MQWLDRARSIGRGIHGISLPDPERIDIGAVPDTATLLDAIDAAMPREAVVELISPRDAVLLAFLATCTAVTRQSDDSFLVPLENGMIARLARVARDCAAHEVCAHLFVHDGDHTLLEALGRDRGEDVVWLSGRLPKAMVRRFLEALPPSLQATHVRASVRVVRQPGRMQLLSSR